MRIAVLDAFTADQFPKHSAQAELPGSMSLPAAPSIPTGTMISSFAVDTNCGVLIVIAISGPLALGGRAPVSRLALPCIVPPASSFITPKSEQVP